MDEWCQEARQGRRSEVGGRWSEIASHCSTEDAVCVFLLMMWEIRRCGQRLVQPSRKRMSRVSSQRKEVRCCAWVGKMISAVGDDSEDGAPIPKARSSSCSSNVRDGAGSCAFGRCGWPYGREKTRMKREEDERLMAQRVCSAFRAPLWLHHFAPPNVVGA